MSFLRLSIKSRLYFGFGAVVALTLALAAFSGWQFLGLRGEIAVMDDVSRAALDAREVAEQLQAIRRANLRYSVKGEQASFDEAEQRETRTLEILKNAEAEASSDARRATYQALRKSVEDLRAARESLGKVVALEIAGRAALFSGGEDFTAAAQKLVQAARDNGDPELIESAARLETDVLLTGIANWRFLATLDASGALNFHIIAAKTSRQIAAMRRPDLPAAITDLIGVVSAALKAYGAAFEQASTNMIDANDLYAKKVQAPAIASSEMVDALNRGYQEDMQAERARSESDIATILGVQEATTALIVSLSVLVAFFVARGISGPLGLMNLAMQKLAAGDHDVAIPAQDQNDEVGKMAKAVLVFKEAAIENARLGAEAAEQRQQAEGARALHEEARQEAITRERAIVANSIGAALAKLAAKDLTYRMSAEIPDAYRMLQADFNAAIGQLEEAIRGVTASTSAIDRGAREISTASNDLSDRTQRQAASLQETATALDEITATVRKSAENANHARQVVSVADGDAKQSASVVGQAVGAMEAIAHSARQIGQIIGVMDEIAFQTNLLALNAGVEAARAGEAGRGFAVVASEVRALAQRSAEAAKEIKALISTSSAQVENGVKLVAETGTSLKRIMLQVAEINAIVADISAGAQEQSSGIQQVNTALNEMDKVTQQNTSMVQQSTAASHSLSREAEQLSALVGQFRVARASRDDSLRDQLQKAAPHVFRPPAKAEPRNAARPVKAVAQGGGDWDEF